jgi:hypothetical protein
VRHHASERQHYRRAARRQRNRIGLLAGAFRDAVETAPTDALFGQIYVDKARLAALVRKELQTRGQISLAEMIAAYPLEHGLAELVAYLSLAADDETSIIDDAQRQTLVWHEEQGHARQATLPLVIFCRPITANRTAPRR